MLGCKSYMVQSVWLRSYLMLSKRCWLNTHCREEKITQSREEKRVALCLSHHNGSLTSETRVVHLM